MFMRWIWDSGVGHDGHPKFCDPKRGTAKGKSCKTIKRGSLCKCKSRDVAVEQGREMRVFGKDEFVFGAYGV
jgi:hypothetical protein